ncbi:MAG: M15 family metallopeptidase [Chloroflexi bacterium]|nr:MAG: M15 family metallopeptidase [Chloroflexota bacterium]
MLALQRLAGNAAVTEAIKSPSSAGWAADVIQRVCPPVAESAPAAPTKAPAPAKEKAAAEPKIDSVTVSGLSSLKLESSKKSGQAVALVPDGLATATAGEEVAVLLHLHGKFGEDPKDDASPLNPKALLEMPAQMAAFLQSRPGTRMIAIMPIGETVEVGGKYDTRFGGFSADTLINEVFGKLAGSGQLAKGLKPGGIVISVHSGGGLELGRMFASAGRLPSKEKFRGVFAFESIHKDLTSYQNFVRGKLKDDLAALTTLAESAEGGPDRADKVFRDQADYLQNKGFRFMGFAGYGGYPKAFHALHDDMCAWFTDKEGALRKAAGAHYDAVLNLLWANYQVTDVPGSGHYDVLATKNRNLQQALGTLPPTIGRIAASTAAVPTVQRDDPAAVATKPPAFKKEHYAMSTTPVILVPENAKQGMAEVSVDPATFCAEILTKAKLDPAAWYNSFTSGVSFLGRSIPDPMHIDLATHLQTVEKDLKHRFGGPTEDPQIAGDTLRLSSKEGDFAAARDHPTKASISMHMFGLAIDVNYTANPMLGHGKDEAAVFASAGLLVSGTKAAFSNGMSYKQLSELDQMLTTYFSYLDDDAALEARLAVATDAPWKGLKKGPARVQIQQDLNTATRLWARSDADQVSVIKAGGFLDLTEDLVEGMKMSWGGTEYGDMMHFDLRDQGEGQTIHQQIVSYKTAKEEESQSRWAKAHKG